MTGQQKRALRHLEEAFRECKAAGLQFFGVDNVFYVTPNYDPTRDFHQQYQSGDNEYDTVKTDGTYIGSGGW